MPCAVTVPAAALQLMPIPLGGSQEAAAENPTQMMMSKATDRVRIWNTYLGLAWSEAKSLFETANNCECHEEFRPKGGKLPPEQAHALATLVLCTLAIEARANHLIDEMVERRQISKKLGEAAQRLRTDEKWFLLPRLAGKRKQLDPSKPPHQAVRDICALRNSLMHVKYESLLRRQLPPTRKVLSYFRYFLEAEEDMNVVLGRVRAPRQRVLDMGQFSCA
jgi:hypothetical protein